MYILSNVNSIAKIKELEWHIVKAFYLLVTVCLLAGYFINKLYYVDATVFLALTLMYKTTRSKIIALCMFVIVLGFFIFHLLIPEKDKLLVESVEFLVRLYMLIASARAIDIDIKYARLKRRAK